MNKSRFRFVYSLSVLTCALPLVLSHSVISEGKAEGIFDYSDGTNIASIKAGDLLSKGVSTIDQSEIDYLNQYSISKLSYSEAFKNDQVRTARVDDKEYVFAHEQTYTDSKGHQWTWVPKYVEADTNIPFGLYDDVYVASFPTSLGLSSVDVHYELELEIPETVFNSFLNESYNKAVELNGIYEQYEDDLAYYNRRPKSELDYLHQLSLYNQYLEDYQSYLNKLENYEVYQSELAQYEADLAKYNEYLAAKAQYDLDLIAYKEDQEYIPYYEANIEQNTKEYNEFEVQWQNSRYQLSAMNVAYEYDTKRSSSMAQYILSNTVATVLARKDELSVLGVPSELIDNADSSTIKLRTALREYRDLTTDEARYSYYYINYNHIKSNANILLRSLERLGRYPSVRNVARDRGKLEQYNTLIFQLIYFCNAINDGIVYNYEAYNPITGKGDESKPGAARLDENYQIDGYTYGGWLAGYTFIDTTKTATPKTGVLPTKRVTPLEPPKYLPMPVEPALVQKPVAPSVVNEPIEPQEVLEPIPYEAGVVPPTYPTELEPTIFANLLDAYRDGKVVEKEELTEPVQFSVDGSKNVSLNQDKVVVFHDYLDVPRHFVFIDTVGVTYEFESPTKPKDEYFDEYFFDYWTNDLFSLENIDLRYIDESTNLYPVFETGERIRYDITWIYPDSEMQTNVSSGSVPSAPKTPTKEATDDYFYEFDHWEPSLTEAVSNASYEAVFRQKHFYTVTYNIDGNLVERREKEGYLPNAPKTFELEDGTYYLINDFKKEGSSEPGLSPIEGDVTYELYEGSYTKYFTITWDILGQITKERYEEGETITFKGNRGEPIREEQYYSVFTFDHPEPFGEAHSNETIKATYVKTPYPEVILKIDGNTINKTGQYLPGEEVEKPSTYASNLYYYEISGWTMSCSTYIAEFERYRFVEDETIFYNYIGDTLKIDPSLKNLNEIDLNYLFLKMKEGEIPLHPLKIVFSNGEVNLTINQVRYLSMRGAATIGLEFNDLGGRSYSTRLVVKDSLGNDVLIPDFRPEVVVNKQIDYLHSQVYLDDEEVRATLTTNNVRFNAQINVEYRIVPEYHVIVSASSAVQVEVSQTTGRVGDKVHLNYTVQNGYKLNILSARTRGGEEVQIDSNNDMIIPADDVILNFVCTKMRYHINLYVDDTLYASYSANYGDTIYLPQYIKKVGDETFEYIFTGWGNNAESIVVSSNLDLHAQFNKVERKQSSDKQTSNAVKIAGYVAVGTISTGLVVGLFFIFKKIIKH